MVRQSKSRGEVIAVKFQKIIVWTAVETFYPKGSEKFKGTSAIEWVSPALDAINSECQILSLIEGEEYELVKKYTPKVKE